MALPRELKPADVDLDTALRLLALPRELGRHPETGETIIAGIGRFGPYIKHGKTFNSLAADDDVLTIGLNRAVVLLAEPVERAAARRSRCASWGRIPMAARSRSIRGATAPMSAMTASSPPCRRAPTRRLSRSKRRCRC